MMNILFICGSLEPGKNGVGDYVRLFASELIKKNVNVSLLSLKDKNTTHILEDEQYIDNVYIKTLRIPQREKLNKLDKEKIFAFIKKTTPEWISLQFVPYAYHTKGIPLNLARTIKPFIINSNVHIMYHELWVEDKDIKGIFLSCLQKISIIMLKILLRPKISHTHVPLYMKRLRKIGIRSSSLPLFSNIKISNKMKNAHKVGDTNFTIGFFSQVTYRKEIFSFLSDLALDLSSHNIKANILIIGGNEDKVLNLVNEFEPFRDLFKEIISTGYLDENDISLALQQCDLGISPVPQHLLGKSGSVAGFFEHGIPVAAPFIKTRYSHLGIGFFENNLKEAIVIKPSFKSIKFAKKKALHARNIINPHAITLQFLEDINKYN
ncbi:glycosyltransferase family protein [Flavobacterium rhizosphaerae]|uniref:Glycosyltransferase n=1 Tax=Flavobacterium rhizosphaerae TaxID=3163298 RepID=A0ABW8Z0K9_9FLAO